MRNIMSIVLIGLIVLSTNQMVAQKANVELKLTSGDVYSTEMNMNNTINQEMMGQKIAIKQIMVTSMKTKVVDVLANGNFQLEQTYERVKLNMDMNGKSINFDTESSDNTHEMASLNKLKEVVIRYEVSPKGVVSNLSGFKELMQKMADNPQAAQMLKGFANDNMLETYYSYLPKEKIGIGDSYSSTIKMPEMMDMEVDTKYRVESINSNQVNLNISSDIQFEPEAPITQNGIPMNIKAKGKQTGTFVINRKDGMPKSSEVNQDLDMSMSFKNPQSGEDMTIPMKMNSIVKTSMLKR